MNNTILNTLIMAFISIVTAMPAQAANRTWSGSVGTDFENSGNWDTLPANDTTSDIAVFGATVTGNKPSLTKNRGINGMVFQSTTGGWSLDGSYTITNGASGIDDSANTGTDTINANVNLNADQTWTVGAGGNLVVNGVTKAITANRVLTNDTGIVTFSSLDADHVARQFTKRGSGILAITGAAGANLQGKVAIGGGTILIGNKSALGSGLFSAAAGTLQASTDLSGANAVSNNWDMTGVLTISGPNNITMAGNYPGAANTRTLTSSLDNGKTLILSGGIAISSTNTSYNFQLAGIGNTVISGVISNGGTSTASGLTISNTGTTTVNNANTYGGTTSIGATSIVIAGNKTAFGTGILTLNSASGGPGAILRAATDLSGINALANGWNLGTTGGGGATVNGANNITLSGDYSGANGSRYIYSSLDSGKTLVLAGSIGLASTAADVSLYIAGTGEITFSGIITNNAPGGTSTASQLRISNTGVTTLSGANTYGGPTTVSAGVLRLGNVSALPGGIGSTGGTASLSVSGGAVIELASDNFYRPNGTGVSNVTLAAAGGGGFSAYGANRIVNLGGATGQITWAGASFVASGNPLVLNSSSANAQVDFQNPISLSSAARTFQVNDNSNSAADQALISGVISSSTAGNGLVKTGAGTLILSATNTFTGPTTVSNGVLLIHGVTTNSAITVVSGGTLGGTGNVGLASVIAGGAISANGTNTIGTLTATNLTVAENAIIYWNYDATTADLINATGALTLPTNATVYVSGTGALPSNRQMFSLLSGTIGGPATLKWTFIGSGIKATTHAVNYGTHVSLVTSSGTIITLQ